MTDHVTFVHAADLHLDAPFHGISTDDPEVGAALAEATFTAFERIVDLAIERGVDFVVIAGDAYNSADRTVRAQMRFRGQIERLGEAGIDVFLAHGNHDPLGGWSAETSMPACLRVFPSGEVARFEVERDGRVVAAVYGRSFETAAERDNFAPGYQRSDGDPVAIGVLHANVGGNPDYDPYAPCSIEDLAKGRMDYWALGHIHKHEVLSTDPYAVYAGSPQGLNPKETGEHGCCVVGVSNGGAVDVEHVPLAPISWAQADVDVGGAETIEQVIAAVNEACDALRSGAAGPVVARLRLVGPSRLRSRLGQPGTVADILSEVRAEQLGGAAWTWVDRLSDATSAVIDVDAVRRDANFASELVAVSDALAADPKSLAAEIEMLVSPLSTTLGRVELEYPEAEDLLRRARDRALDLLLAEGADES